MAKWRPPERRLALTAALVCACDLAASVLLLSAGYIPNFVLFVVRAILLLGGVELALNVGKGRSICRCFSSSRTLRRNDVASDAAIPLAVHQNLGTDVTSFASDAVDEQRAREEQLAKHRWKTQTAVIICFVAVAVEAVFTAMQVSALPTSMDAVPVALCTTLVCMCFEFLNVKSLVKRLCTDEGIKMPAVHEHPLHYKKNISMAFCNVCGERIGPRTGGYEAFVCRECEGVAKGGGKGGGKDGGKFHLCMQCYRKQSIHESVSQEGILRGDKGPKPCPDLSAWDYARRTLKMTSPFKFNFLAAIVCVVIAELSSVLLPNQQGGIINSLTAGDKSDFEIALRSFVVLSVIAAAFNSIKSLTVQLVAKQLQLAMRSDMLKSIMKQDIAFFDGVMTGQLTSRMTNDVGSVTQPITQVVNTFLSSLIQFCGSAFMCFFTSWKLTLLALTMIGPVIYITGIYAQWSKNINLTVRANLGDANACATETLRNIRTVRSFGAVPIEQAVFDGFLAQAWANMRKDAWAAAGIGAISGYVNFAAGVLIYWYGGSAVLDGSDSQLNLGNLVTFNMYWAMLGNSIKSMNNLLNTMVVAASAARRVYEIVDLEPDIKIDDQEAVALEQVVPVGQACSIDFRNVHFSYQMRPDSVVLAGLSFSIPAGSTCALVGKSGCGKSTAFQLLMRFYDPQEGEILVHGMPLTSINLQSYQRRMSIVSQETQMFARSIKDNLTYGMRPDDYTDEDVIIAAKRANAHDFIEQMDQSYHSLLGEGGGGLSGGQKQRLAIARAFLRRPQLLFLDEATSALDSQNEKQIQLALDDMVEQMGSSVSVVMIAHRLSTVMGCDKIIVIHEGQVLEEGSHAELMGNDRVYASLVRTQMVKEAQDATEAREVTESTVAKEEDASAKAAATEDNETEGGWGKGKSSIGKGKGGKAGKEGKDGKKGKKGKSGWGGPDGF